MWHALRAELAYSRLPLLTGLGIAVGVVVILSVVFFAVGDDGPSAQEAGFLRGIFLVMAPLVTGFVVQGFRTEERRVRLLLSGPVTPRQIAGASVLLPVVFLGIGVLAAGLAIAAGALVAGTVELESLSIVGFVGAQMFAYVQLGLMAQESAVARRQRRSRQALAAWTGFAAAVLLLAVLCLVSFLEWMGSLTWLTVILGHLIVAVAAMAATVELYAGRTDFTR